jgi:SpoVK/Ycf46/Vps4 family AAA+-type ATPase
MQNEDATGIIMVGAPGTSKSMVSKAAGKAAGIPTIQFDLGAVKSSNVGASEHNMRQALNVIGTITNHAPLFLATCNSLQALSPELRRRFRLGTFIFPLPTREERQAIWTIYQRKYQLSDPPGKLLEERWTGAEIRQCCDIAWRLNITLDEAAQYIVPVAVSAKDSITDLYGKAHHAFLCASYPGLFDKDRLDEAKPQGSGRKMRVVANHHGEA